MKKNKLYSAIALCAGLNGSSIMPSIPTPTVNVHFDNLDGLSEKIGKEAGTIAKEIITEVISGAGEAISKAGKDKNLGKNLEEGFKSGSQQIANAGANALGDPKLQQEFERGGANFASTIGKGAQSTQQGLRKDFWPHIDAMGNDALSSFFNAKNAFQVGSPFALTGAIAITGYYGTRLAWKVLEKRMLDPRPDILLPGSKYGRWDRISRWRAGYQTPAMIFDAEVKDRLIEIKEKTKNIRDNIYNGRKTTYDNLLLYGKPGTGKTLFAQILADETNMDFLPVTAASLLQSGVEGIKYFNELLAMANRSKYGLILFVDEADALFVDRDSLNPSSDHYKVLNHILALTGTGSNNFMLIAATNHAYVMDAAMGRRFQDRVLMPLPDAITRKELINLYAGNVLLNVKNNSKEFIDAAQSLLTTQKINTIVQQTAELSYAEIKDMIHAMHKKALTTKNAMITTAHVNSAVDQAVQKHAALENDKVQREQHQLAAA